MWRHIRTTCQIAGSEKGMDKLYEYTLQQQLTDHATQMKHIQAQLDGIQLAAGTNAINATAANQVLQVAGQVYNAPVTHINFFGREDTSHIDRPRIRALLDDVLSSTPDPTTGALTAFLKAAMLIYSDPNIPENITCYLPSSKKEDVLVHGAEGWEVQPYTVVLPPMATRSVDALFNNQPFDNCEKYDKLMGALRDNEAAYKVGGKMKTVLVLNKALLERVLGSLPK